MDEVTYEIEQHGDSFVLYSLVQTPLGGVAKNFVRRAQTAGELASTIRRLQKCELRKDSCSGTAE
jgi:hypothetical protein